MHDGFVPANRNWVDYLRNRLPSTFPEVNPGVEGAPRRRAETD
jgi:hypothetical protein